MNFCENLEIDLPKIKISKEKILIDTNYGNSFNLIIENIAGGFLVGTINKVDDFIKISTDVIDKNLINLEVSVDESLECDKTYYSLIKIFSNGGDIEVLVEVKTTKAYFEVDSVTKIYSMNDLFSLFNRDFITFAENFKVNELKLWLQTLKSNYIDIYNFVLDDENIYRSCDNFFTLLGMKNKTEVFFEEENIFIDIKQGDNDIIHKVIKLKKSNVGFFEATLRFDKNYDFIKIDKNVICFLDMPDSDECFVTVEIDVKKIKNKRDECFIIINGDAKNKISIVVRKSVIIFAEPNKAIFKDGETGFVEVNNYLNEPIKYKVTTNSKNINIISSSGEIKEKGKIDFNIHFTTFNKSVVKFFGQPYFDGVISVLFENDSVKIKKEINITMATEVLELK